MTAYPHTHRVCGFASEFYINLNKKVWDAINAIPKEKVKKFFNDDYGFVRIRTNTDDSMYAQRILMYERYKKIVYAYIHGHNTDNLVMMVDKNGNPLIYDGKNQDGKL